MQAFKKNLAYVLSAFLPLLILAQPAVAEPTILEQPPAADPPVEISFEAGSGLPVGKILSVRGSVDVFHRDMALGYPAQTGLPLYHGDTIIARINGRIFCRLIDGSRFLLTPESTLTILQCNYNSARQTSVSLLYLRQGNCRFQVKALADLSSNEFKAQTETAFILSNGADFIIKANPGISEITALDQSQLEVTRLAEPEEFFFLSAFQRTVVGVQSVPPTVEAVSQQQAEAMMAEFRLLPKSQLYASSAEKYLRDATAETATESVDDAREQSAPLDF
jgi:hypothetical protein